MPDAWNISIQKQMRGKSHINVVKLSILKTFQLCRGNFMEVSHSIEVTVEVDFLWNRTVDLLKTSFHPLLWTSSGLRDS